MDNMKERFSVIYCLFDCSDVCQCQSILRNIPASSTRISKDNKEMILKLGLAPQVVTLCFIKCEKNWQIRPPDVTNSAVQRAAGCGAQYWCEAESLEDRASLVTIFCLPVCFHSSEKCPSVETLPAVTNRLLTINETHLMGAGPSTCPLPVASFG